MNDPAVAVISPRYGAPFDVALQLLDNATVATTEGLWLPSRFVKNGSIEIAGSMSTVSVQILGTNQFSEPLNAYTITIGGTVATGHTVTITMANTNIPGGTASVSYVTTGTDTATTVAAALAALMAVSPGMVASGVTVSAAAGVITAQYPSIYPQANTLVPLYGFNFGNLVTFSGSSTGAETVTVAGVTTIGSTIGSAITALGITALTVLPRWIRARMTVLTGGSAFINATFCGAG
jgi:hypothetical protein